MRSEFILSGLGNIYGVTEQLRTTAGDAVVRLHSAINAFHESYFLTIPR
ncbi:MAG: hypothetical protein P8M65_06910 [Roseibacillus sp.]|nr:hypothetical protein [Roseibacillus sp.]